MKERNGICAFFGHRSYGYERFREKIKSIIIDLIENYGVSEFYNGFRGDFDKICAGIVGNLREIYPVKNIMVLSYHPKAGFTLPVCFDESVYLLDRTVIPKFAISYTNQCVVDKADFIVSGVVLDSGGAWTACEYARRKKKRIINIFST